MSISKLFPKQKDFNILNIGITMNIYKIVFKNIILFLSLTFFSSCNENQDKGNVLKNFQISTERFIIHKNFPSKYVLPRNIEIWLPSGYDSLKALPVLYMFDGQNIFHGKKGWFSNKYNHGWQVDNTLDSLFLIQKAPKMIVVGIYNLGVMRRSEYMPAKPLEEVRKRINQSGNSNHEDFKKYGILSDEFLKFLVEELKPFIDDNYKTFKDKDNTFLAGSSMGGLISLYAICEYPDIFGGAACLSTHWPILDGVFIDYLKNKIPDYKSHKIYFDFGTLGLDSLYEPYQLLVDSIMIENGYTKNKNWVTKKYFDEDHNEDYWRARFHIPIDFFFN